MARGRSADAAAVILFLLSLAAQVAYAQSPAKQLKPRPVPSIQCRAELIDARISATSTHGWQTNRILKYRGAYYASAALPNPTARDFWDHSGAFYKRLPSGSWKQVGTIPYDPYTMMVGPDGTFWAVAPGTYESCHVFRTRVPGDLSSFEEVFNGTCSYAGASISPEGNVLVMYAESWHFDYGVPNAVNCAFWDVKTQKWYISRIPTPEGRYGYEGIILRGRTALAVLNSSLVDPKHPDYAGTTNFSWRHLRLARCEDLTGGKWKCRGWIMPENGITRLEDMVQGPDGYVYISLATVSAPTSEALHQLHKVPHYIARVHNDLTVGMYPTGINEGHSRILIDSRGGFHLIAHIGAPDIYLWDLDPLHSFRPTRQYRLAGTDKFAGYVIHTLRPDRFGGESDGNTIHLVGTTNSSLYNKPIEINECELWAGTFNLPHR